MLSDLELKFSTRVAATGPAVAPKIVAEDPASTPSERAHHITWWGKVRVKPNTMGKKRAVVGPAFKKEVKRAADHIKIRQSAQGLPKERTASPSTDNKWVFVFNRVDRYVTAFAREVAEREDDFVQRGWS